MRLADYDCVVLQCYDTRWPEPAVRAEQDLRTKGSKVEVFLSGNPDGRIPRVFYSATDDYFDHPPPGWIHPVGCWRHLKIFRYLIRCAKKDNVRNLLVTEDDLQLTSEFDAILNAALPTIPDDWDLLYYGAMHADSPTTRIAPHLLRLHGSFGLHCVGIRRKAFDAILANLDDSTTLDTQMSRLHGTLNAYAIWPSIAIARPCWSTITGTWSNPPEVWMSEGCNR